MGVIILVIIVGIIVVFLFNTNESCSRFKDEKEIARCLKLTEEQFQRVKELDGNFVNYFGDVELETFYAEIGKSGNFYGYKNYLIDRAKKIGQRFSDKGSMILGISTFVVLLVVWIFGLHTMVDYDSETEIHYLCLYSKYIPIADPDWHMCKLYSFVCSLVSWISYIGFGAYFVSYISSKDHGELTEKNGYIMGMSVMLVGFATHLVFFRYIMFMSSDMWFLQYRLRDFGWFNLWSALIALILICVTFVCHRYESKKRYMNNVCEKIEEFYEKEKSNLK